MFLRGHNKKKAFSNRLPNGPGMTATMSQGGTMSLTGTFKAGEDRLRSTNIVAILDVPEPVRLALPCFPVSCAQGAGSSGTFPTHAPRSILHQHHHAMRTRTRWHAHARYCARMRARAGGPACPRRDARKRAQRRGRAAARTRACRERRCGQGVTSPHRYDTTA